MASFVAFRVLVVGSIASFGGHVDQSPGCWSSQRISASNIISGLVRREFSDRFVRGLRLLAAPMPQLPRERLLIFDLSHLASAGLNSRETRALRLSEKRTRGRLDISPKPAPPRGDPGAGPRRSPNCRLSAHHFSPQSRHWAQNAPFRDRKSNRRRELRRSQGARKKWQFLAVSGRFSGGAFDALPSCFRGPERKRVLFLMDDPYRTIFTCSSDPRSRRPTFKTGQTRWRYRRAGTRRCPKFRPAMGHFGLKSGHSAQNAFPRSQGESKLRVAAIRGAL